MSSEYQRGLRDAFVAMTRVRGFSVYDMLEAMAIAGVGDLHIPELEAAKEQLAKRQQEREAWLATLPDDYDERKAI